MKLQKVSKNKLKLKKNDQVFVIAGKDKGKQGKILEVNRAKQRVLVEGVNLLTNYERPTQQNQKGGIIKKEGFLSVSNVMLFCPKCDKGVRTRSLVSDDGVKNRTCAKCGDII